MLPTIHISICGWNTVFSRPPTQEEEETEEEGGRQEGERPRPRPTFSNMLLKIV